MLTQTQTPGTPLPDYHVSSQEEACRNALGDAATHLQLSARLLARPEPEYAEVMAATLRTVRQAYTALLEWHSLPPREDATLDELARPAERLASMLRTCRDRGWPLDHMATSLRKGAGVTPVVRDGALASYYTARNTLIAVIAELPEHVGREATAGVIRAQAIRAARASQVAAAPADRPAPRPPTAGSAQRTPGLAERVS